MDQNLAVAGKKFWKIVRVAFYMLRKGISKQKIMLDIKLMMKRSKISSYKAAIQNLMFHFHHHNNNHHHRHNDTSNNLPFSPPQKDDDEYYEFSCSSSPNFNLEKQMSRHESVSEEDVIVMNAAVMKALEMIKREAAPSLSPNNYYMSGFGRQLRITDSPFTDVEEVDNHVDEAADEFISKFYRNLRRQSSLSVA